MLIELFYALLFRFRYYLQFTFHLKSTEKNQVSSIKLDNQMLVVVLFIPTLF